ncbi:MAG: hypothetical protein KDC67_03370 [Ignavibacteriae bacterium]|nr:hypothetical protein [Ignavibacteriota bacterium]
MNTNEKKEILKNLSEKEFRQELLIPLLSKMSYKAPTEYHGTSEKGKDIICFEYDRLNEQRFLAIVAKTGNLTGNASSNAGLMNVVNQVQQAFDSPYEDLFNMRQVFVNEVWVMTTGKIVSGAQESVINTLRKTNLDKQIRIIGDDRLVQLIDMYFSTYWNSNSETKESVIIQRDRLITFIENILVSNNIDRSTIEEVKSSILYSDFNPKVSKNIDGLHFSSVSPYSIELAKIDSEFDDFIVSNIYGITREIFKETKKYLSYSFFDVEETMEKANKISKITNHWEFTVEALSHLVDEYPFHNPYGSASKFVDNIHYMEEGLYELKIFKAFLKKREKLEWAKKLAKSTANLLPEIENIIKNSHEEIITINFFIEKDDVNVRLEYNSNNPNSFSFSDKRIKEKGFGRNKDGTLNASKIIDYSLHKLRDYIEKELEYDNDKWLEEYESD